MQMNIHKDHQDNGLSIHNNCIYISRAAHTRKMLSIALISVSISHVQGLGLFYGGPFVTKIGTTCTCWFQTASRENTFREHVYGAHVAYMRLGNACRLHVSRKTCLENTCIGYTRLEETLHAFVEYIYWKLHLFLFPKERGMVSTLSNLQWLYLRYIENIEKTWQKQKLSTIILIYVLPFRRHLY